MPFTHLQFVWGVWCAHFNSTKGSTKFLFVRANQRILTIWSDYLHSVFGMSLTFVTHGRIIEFDSILTLKPIKPYLWLNFNTCSTPRFTNSNARLVGGMVSRRICTSLKGTATTHLQLQLQFKSSVTISFGFPRKAKKNAHTNANFLIFNCLYAY